MRLTWIGAAALCAWSAAVSATTLNYEVVPLGGQNWRYEITVSNDTLGVPIDEFTIFFPFGSIAALADAGQPAGFDPLVFPPDPGLLLDGAVDYLATGPGIAPGASLGTFDVEVAFTGTGKPGTFSFDIVDPVTFETLDSGRGVAAGAIPEPGTLALVSLTLLGMTRARRRR
jgi:hypothetical protein